MATHQKDDKRINVKDAYHVNAEYGRYTDKGSSRLDIKEFRRDVALDDPTHHLWKFRETSTSSQADAIDGTKPENSLRGIYVTSCQWSPHLFKKLNANT